MVLAANHKPELNSNYLEFTHPDLSCPFLISPDAELYDDAEKLFLRLLPLLTMIKNSYAEVGIETYSYKIEKQHTSTRALVFTIKMEVLRKGQIIEPTFILKYVDSAMASGRSSRIFVDINREISSLSKIHNLAASEFKAVGITYPHIYGHSDSDNFSYILMSKVEGEEMNYDNMSFQNRIEVNIQLTKALQILVNHNIYNLDPNKGNILGNHNSDTNWWTLVGMIDLGATAIEETQEKELIPGRIVKTRKLYPAASAQGHDYVKNLEMCPPTWDGCLLFIRQLLLANLAEALFKNLEDIHIYQGFTDILETNSTGNKKFQAKEFILARISKLYINHSIAELDKIATQFANALCRRNLETRGGHNLDDIIELHEMLKEKL